MARYTGKNLVVTWNGTDISANYRTLSTNEVNNTVDSTAGTDDYIDRLGTQKDWTATLELLDVEDGSTTWTNFAPGSTGTLVWNPEGTGSGKIQYTNVCIVNSRDRSMAYNDVVSMSIGFENANQTGPSEATN